mgnify:CR=1 FL=1
MYNQKRVELGSYRTCIGNRADQWYFLCPQASITHAADEALRSSEVRQAAAREEVQAAADKAAAEAREQLQVSREQTDLKIGAIRDESEELLKRLGISRKK